MTILTLTNRGRISILPIRNGAKAAAETEPQTKPAGSRSAAEIQHLQKSMANALLCCGI